MRGLVLLLLVGCTGLPPERGTDGTDGTDHSDTDGVEDGWRSALYPRDWEPTFTDPSGAFLHDFSYAGYRNGEEPVVREGPVFNVLDQGADATGATDSTAAIQATLDAASVEGGVVLLPAGTFRVDDRLYLRSSNVVIRGAGTEQTRVAFTKVDAMTDRAHLTIGGRTTFGPDRLLTADAASRSTTIEVADTTGLEPGMDVALGWVITDDFVGAHDMTGTWQQFNGTWRPFFRRTVVSVSGDSVTLDVPIRYLAKMSDSASLRVENGIIREVGVEDLSVSTKAPWYEAWANDRSHAIDLVGVADGWVTGLGSFDHGLVDEPERGERHLQSGGIKILDSKRITVADSSLRLAQNRGGGGNGYLFEISRSSEILTRDSVAEGGRHNFIQNWDFGTSGCVWLRTTSSGGYAATSPSGGFGQLGLSEFHHSLAMANLIEDSVIDDGWAAVNRGSYSSGAGHSATQSVFYNNRGDGEIRSFQAGLGFIIGTQGLTIRASLDDFDPFRWSVGSAPEDWMEGIDEADDLVPKSLYEDMRKKRLGR